MMICAVTRTPGGGAVAAGKPSSSSALYLLSCVCAVSVVADVELTSMRTLAVMKGVNK